MNVKYILTLIEDRGFFFGKLNNRYGWYKNINYAVTLRDKSDFDKYYEELKGKYFIVEKIYHT